MPTINSERFDRANAVLAVLVFLVSFVVYALTVQRSFSFWDCGEFIACSYSLAIPHPPGTPMFILLGRVISLIPFVEDISHRINYLSVIGSAFTAMFSYLLVVRMAGYFFGERKHEGLNRYIAYIGGLAGGFFVAFSDTNWANSVEAEVYGMALALSCMIVWLTLRYFEQRGTPSAARTIVLVAYLAMVGIGVHMTVYLVVPICAIFFILRMDAEPRDWMLLAGFVIIELLMILLFSDGRGGSRMFYLVSAVLGVVLLVLLYRKINWALLLAIASLSTIMISFSLYELVTPIVFGIILVLGLIAKKQGWQLHWKTGLAVVFVGFMGMSVHGYIPIRSAQNPRIDENNPSRDWRTFVNYLDRKQYGQVSMVDRMFYRRGAFENQFGRHPHMGFWSYFEEQYSSARWGFAPFFLLGVIGIAVLIKRRPEIGMPFLVLVLVCSAGLILYMNFADGTKYNPRSGDAYLEVRNRDYFFTPAFVFFGISMGLGVSALMWFVRRMLGGGDPNRQRPLVYASTLLLLLPGIALGKNYHRNDRSKNVIPYNYAANILDSCEPNAILFTSGDNDTFPLWCIQEVYKYRLDVRVVNLSLLNTDWYVEQMKNRYDVPISLSDEQILWYPYEVRKGVWAGRPLKPFLDRPRRQTRFLQAQPYPQGSPHAGKILKVQDMMVDEIVISNNWKSPIYFSSPPYAESPLNLRDHATTVGLVYRLDREPPNPLIDVDKSYDLIMNTYRYDGYESSEVFRDENATGVFLGYGVQAVRLYDELMRREEKERAIAVAEKMIKCYPEYWQSYFVLVELYEREGDSATADSLMRQLHDTLTAFVESNPGNVFYRQHLGLAKVERGRRLGDQAMTEEGIDVLWAAFEDNANNSYGFQTLVTVLGNQRRFSDIQRAAEMFGTYKRNLEHPLLQQLLGLNNQGTVPLTPGEP